MNHSFCILLCKKILLNRTRARSVFLWHNLQNSVRLQRNGHAPAVTKPTMVIGLRLVPWCCMRSCRECWAISSRATTQISLLDAHPMKYRRWLSPGFVLSTLHLSHSNSTASTKRKWSETVDSSDYYSANVCWLYMEKRSSTVFRRRFLAAS